MPENVAFVICSERGPLACKSLLLCESIREFGGAYSKAPIYSFAPRADHYLTPATIELFDMLGVVHSNMPLNTGFVNYPFANKILSALHVEQETDADWIVFLDSDKIMLSEPEEMFSNEHDFAARPVDKKNIGIVDFDDTEGAYWRGMYDLLRVTRVDDRVTTTRDGETIFPYYNGGMIAVRREAGFFARFLKNFEMMWDNGLVPKAGPNFIEQSTLATTAIAMGLRRRVLSPSYNYPIHHHNAMAPEARFNNLESLVTAHYHGAFDKNFPRAWMNSLAGFDSKTPKAIWWLNKLNEYQVPATPMQVMVSKAKAQVRHFVRGPRALLKSA
jgi:hypothetical protein